MFIAKSKLWITSVLSMQLLSSVAEGFAVYWNVPTEKCHQFGIYFNLSSYSIIQNSGDAFHGDKMNIIYSPGRFPHFEGEIPIWGGIPQKADFGAHLAQFQHRVQKQIPSNYSGYVVLDFEAYQPSYEISSEIYKEKSRNYVKKLHPNLPSDEVEDLARRSFDIYSKILFQSLLEEGKALRPNAKWGYYHYPYCKNHGSNYSHCETKQVKANEAISWFFEASDVIFPSIYVYEKGFTSFTRGRQALERIRQAKKISGKFDVFAVSYFWFKFHDSVEKYLAPIDVWNTIGLSWYNKLDGTIIWGGGNDVRTKEKCLELKMKFVYPLRPFESRVVAPSDIKGFMASQNRVATA